MTNLDETLCTIRQATDVRFAKEAGPPLAPICSRTYSTLHFRKTYLVPWSYFEERKVKENTPLHKHRQKS